MYLKLNDEDFNYLLNLSKEILEQYNIKIDDNCKGDISITSCNSEYFFHFKLLFKTWKSNYKFQRMPLQL